MPLPRRCRGDQRRAVGERRPGAVGELGVGLGQHLPRHGHVVRHRHAVERAFAREGGELLRLLPAQRAAERCGRRGAASPAPDRRRPPARCGPAKRTSTPPSSIHLVEPLARLAGDIADIGEDQHRQALVEEAASPPRAGEPRSASRTSANGLSARDEIIGRRRAAAASGRRSSRRRRRRCGGASACRAVARRRPSARRRFPAARRRCGSRPAGRSPPRSRGRSALKANGASPSGRPLRSMRAAPGRSRARRSARAAPSRSARRRRCRRRRAHARAAMPPSTTVSGRCRCSACKPCDEVRALAEIDAVRQPDAVRRPASPARKRVDAPAAPRCGRPCAASA